jgi:hypothetical protein
MTEHLSREDLQNYRRLEQPRRRAIDAHLASCPSCVKSLVDSGGAPIAFDSLNEAFLPAQDETPFHLTHTDLQNWLAHNADEADSIIYSSHLEDCADCRAELQAVRESAARTAAPAITTFEANPTRSFGPWLTPARAAAVLAAVIVIVIAVVLLRRQQLLEPNHLAEQGATPTLVNSQTPTSNPPQTVSPALVVLKDGEREIRIENDGRLSGLENFDESSQRAAQAALKGEALTKPGILGELSTAKIRLLGTPDDETFQLIGPIGRVVAEDRPAFRWRPSQGAENYVVSVFDGNFNRVIQSPPLTTTQWTPDVPLSRGGTYSWEVKASREGKETVAPAAPAGAAKFVVLASSRFDALSKLKRQTPLSHLVLGTEYARAGLVTDAEREFRELIKQNPDSPVAKKLLRTVQGWR